MREHYLLESSMDSTPVSTGAATGASVEVPDSVFALRRVRRLLIVGRISVHLLSASRSRTGAADRTWGVAPSARENVLVTTSPSPLWTQPMAVVSANPIVSSVCFLTLQDYDTCGFARL